MTTPTLMRQLGQPVHGSSFVLLASVAGLFGCDANQLVKPSELGGEPVTALAAGQLVAAPSSLAAVAVSEKRIDLTWLDNSSNENGFELYGSRTGATGEFYTLLSADLTATSISDAQPDTEYCFRIRAVRRTGLKSTYSGFSNT